MFDPGKTPRVFALPPGVDFADALVSGLLHLSAGHPPEALARVELLVNTRRMQRRIRALFDTRPAMLLPRLRLVTDLGHDMAMADIPPAAPALRRRLELSQLVAKLLQQAPDLAPRSAVFDLADSLADLMDEMQGEGVTADQIADLDVTDQSGHWDRALRFVSLVQTFLQGAAPDVEARQRRIVKRLIARWQDAPPDHPIIIVGSTGSRGTTHLLMQAVARLPQGALVLPGFDFDLPASVWAGMTDALTSEDHPQFRFARLMQSLDLTVDDIAHWQDVQPPCPPRNALISLALRPAPVTDQWMIDGRKQDRIAEATADMTLIEAPSMRSEAAVIALRLRRAARDGQTAALISPDRLLTRQVTAALDRWGIEPDDSAGRPLPLSAPGRFLRQVSALFHQKLTSEALLALLKHPLTNTGTNDRGQHLLWTRELELHLRRNGPPFPTIDSLQIWAADKGAACIVWADWLGQTIIGLEQVGTRDLAAHVKHHIAAATALAGGPGADAAGELWLKQAGREARKVVDELIAHADAGGDISPTDYDALFHAILNRAEVRDPVRPHANIMIWGTLEARVQGADLVILGGLNDGVWPESPTPDPWLNRKMRETVGLLLPERRIGLSAHDFQQAVAAKEVWLTRAIRDAEAETVPSRWINRLTNLLQGLPDKGGDKAMKAMQARGQKWLALAANVEAPKDPVSPEKRPSPCPPATQRPRELPVTQIGTLIRDPYAVYARYILKLRPLDPLRREPDAPLRGIVVHDVMENFVRQGGTNSTDLLRIADDLFRKRVSWPTAQRIWRAKLARVSGWFLEGEARRRALATPDPELLETTGKVDLTGLDFTLTGRADRIDRATDGSVYLYDYKTGAPPSIDQQTYFDKQLLLEAAMIERGGFKKLGKATVAAAVYIGLGTTPKEQPAPLDDPGLGVVWEQLHTLISNYSGQKRGYSSRRAMTKQRFGGDYDHLARFGEWDVTDDVEPEDMP